MDGVARLNYDELNSTLRYAMWSVFRTDQARLPDDRRAAAEEFAAAVDEQEAKGVVVRGVYDLAGMRADADWMVWTHAPDVESLQATYTALRRTALGRASTPVWSNTALHGVGVPACLATGDAAAAAVVEHLRTRSEREAPSLG